MRQRLHLIVAMLAVGAAAVSGVAPAAQLAHGRDAFVVDVPPGCVERGTRDDLNIDYQVFYFSCRGKTYAGVYVGNAARSDIPRSRVIRTGLEWPAQVQVWSKVVPDDQQKADKIAASVRLRQPK